MSAISEAREQLANAGLSPDEVEALVRAALAEDLRGGDDVTSAATMTDQPVTADVVARADGVLSGLSVAELAFALTVPDVEVRRWVDDGDVVSRDDRLLTVVGPGRGLLTAERTALNLLCHLSGVATLTSRWVAAVADSKAQIRDTRKTTPLLRSLEKYAVRCGGGVNHRMGLSDAALVKDNHVAAAGGVVEAYRRVRERYPDLQVQVEVVTPEQAVGAVEAGADEVLLDNMAVAEMRRAVDLVAGRARLEASGGLTIDRAPAVAATGVDYLAVGALTHSAPVLDIAMDLRPA
ncbi:MAG TPA: carboxylating nicotinate-nucleotide diphosphorylase [Nocardioidaceae bacterium]|nr:carboxylating nicotinate-nucleotide diphosphorylase [Nocardioidaceae bacterium]